MSDTDTLKANIVQRVLDKKFSRANAEFANLMRDKAYAAIDDFKNAYSYIAVEKAAKEAEAAAEVEQPKKDEPKEKEAKKGENKK